MAGRKPLLAEVPKAPDAAPTLMDEAQFRKLEEERDRPRAAATRLFGRRGPMPQKSLPQKSLPLNDPPQAPAGIRNLPVLHAEASRHIDAVRLWNDLSPVALDDDWLSRGGLFPRPSTEPAAAAFDILRTRVLMALRENRISRIAVTSPTHGCGKTLVAANLALSLSRRPGSRTLLMDMELRRPQLAEVLGLHETAPMREVLMGRKPFRTHILRAGGTLALALNGRAEPQAAEILMAPETQETLAAITEALDPEVVIYDMPPALVSDDVVGFAPQIDAVLLVADATQTTAEEVKACERLFEDRIPLLGVVLNRSQEVGLSRYRYGRRKR